MENKTPHEEEYSKNDQWAQQAIEKIAHCAIDEQRRNRRWGIFFKISFLVYLVGISILLAGNWGSGEMYAHEHTAVIQLHGPISIEDIANANNINQALRTAFKEERAKGIILRINSPGGSPVQSGLIYDEIVRLREKHPEKPMYVVVEDICASGGYYIASAAEKIYVNRASIVGSIGVLIDGFGFTQTIKKLGIERRLLTAGKNKGFLDPFSSQDEAQKTHALSLLKQLHGQFINAVKEGRGARLKQDTPNLFSGLLWTGEQSIEFGLADEYGSVESVARDVLKADKIVDYTPEENALDRLSKRLNVSSSYQSFWKSMQPTMPLSGMLR